MSTYCANSLNSAMKSGDLNKVRQMINDGAQINGRDMDDWTPLHVAAYEGLAAIVRDLLDHKAEVNATNEAKETALHLAARRGHLAVVEILLDYGAAVHPRNRYASTPLAEATESGHQEIVKLLRTRMNLKYVHAIANFFRHMSAMVSRKRNAGTELSH